MEISVYLLPFSLRLSTITDIKIGKVETRESDIRSVAFRPYLTASLIFNYLILIPNLILYEKNSPGQGNNVALVGRN